MQSVCRRSDTHTYVRVCIRARHETHIGRSLRWRSPGKPFRAARACSGSPEAAEAARARDFSPSWAEGLGGVCSCFEYDDNYHHNCPRRQRPRRGLQILRLHLCSPGLGSKSCGKLGLRMLFGYHAAFEKTRCNPLVQPQIPRHLNSHQIAQRCEDLGSAAPGHNSRGCRAGSGSAAVVCSGSLNCKRFPPLKGSYDG